MSALLYKELKLLDSKLAKRAEVIKSRQMEDPSADFFQVHKELKQLLDENEGEKRSTKEFLQKITALSEREKSAKKKMRRKISSNQQEKDSKELHAIHRARSRLNLILWAESCRSGVSDDG